MMKATIRTSMASRQVKCSERRRSYQFMDRPPDREPGTGNSSFLLRDRGQHGEEVDGLPHVVYADQRGPRAMGGGNGGQRSGGAIGARVAAGEMSDERLTRSADDQRSDCRQFAGRGQKFEVVLEGLAESDPRIDEDPGAIDPRGDRRVAETFQL